LDRARKPVFIIPLPHDETGVTIGEFWFFKNFKKGVMESKKNLTSSSYIVYSIQWKAF
jgi:hypothetical protein